MTKAEGIKVSKACFVPENFYGNISNDGKVIEPKKAQRNDEPEKNTQKIDIIKEKKKINIFKGCTKLLYTGARKKAELLASFFKSSAQDFLICTKALLKKSAGGAKCVAKKASFSALVSLGMLFLMLIFAFCFCTVSYTVSLGGIDVGTVSDKSDYFDVVDEINSNLIYSGKEEFLKPQSPEFTAKLTLSDKQTPKDELKERIKSTSSDFLPAYAVLVDDCPVFATVGLDEASDVLNEYKLLNSAQGKAKEITFLNNVTIDYIFIPKTMLKTKESALSFLIDGKYFSYYAKDGESLKEISAKTGAKEEAIIKANLIGDSDNLSAGVLKIYTGEPIISTKTVANIDESVELSYETIKKEDSTKYIGTSIVEKEGKVGKKQIQAVVTIINGEETARDIISENVTCEPENRIEIVGTKERPSPYGTGDFATPTMGQISSRFGSRWGRNHDGIDVAANEGTPIYAADNGTVVCSEFNKGGYGNLIEIDHANGYVTYYAHCSSRVVNKGDVVAKGDLIGYVGNTGRSTGPHLHFEVRKDDVPCDPLEFID